ncbi:MAG: DnaJ domain-containing protein [Desulfovibrionales bacterium]
MDLEQSYQILEVAPGTSLEGIKKSYRTLAFRYHPDLNQDDPRSSRKFQELNEAFVTLRKHLEGKKTTTYDQKGRTKKEHTQRTKQGRTRRENFSYRKEEVLRDILNDPFARKVFEDIYSQVRREGAHRTETAKGPATRVDRHVEIELGRRKITLNAGQGIVKGIRSWVSSQLNDEQTMHIPYYQIVPGTRIQIQVSHRWSKKSRSVEVTIPSGYLPGRPLRLKGLGRKLGPWSGDLYLRIQPR